MKPPQFVEADLTVIVHIQALETLFKNVAGPILLSDMLWDPEESGYPRVCPAGLDQLPFVDPPAGINITTPKYILQEFIRPCMWYLACPCSCNVCICRWTLTIVTLG
eukprot:CAMPEP_0172760254 /NCGR_PEP_ID=MMETSP1074-20121228/169248_1 /TAXON_ID=2916 /ORGANISM="Ceratium fusus, Strain PA161109" /LENGTH=106 /DNA_ID=CAMNT_0013594191 /DNA_START=52 /DNA_END=369 /DNA_ORIENTATION=-